MKITVITNCTSRKRDIGPALLGHGRSDDSLENFAQDWISQIGAQRTVARAQDLYLGRSMGDAKYVAEQCAAVLQVVSAGLGMVGGQTCIPNYELTIVPGKGSLRPWLVQHGHHVSDWWHAVNTAQDAPNPLSRHINASRQDDLYLIALPATYVELVARDLAGIDPLKLDRVRVFTSAPGRAALPDAMATQAMPYDDRLEGVPGHSGTRADFPQRAMRHFVDALQGHLCDTKRATKLVCAAMQASRAKTVPVRAKLDDEAVARLIAENWVAADGQAGRLLRILRDDKLVACEQARFSGLWRQVRERIASGARHV